MKHAASALFVIFWMAILIQLSSCVFQKQAPDPVKVQEEIAAYRSEELELVRATIADPKRAERFVRLLGQRDELVSDSTKIITAYRQQMTRLNADYHAERASFTALVSHFNRQRAESQKQYVDLFAAMKAETKPGEWKVIANFQMKRLHHRQLTYGQVAGGS